MITIYKDIKDTSNPHYITVEKALERIQFGQSKHIVYQIRYETNKKERSKLKAKLPSVCFSGKFTDRKDECLIEHSGFVILDFDDLKDVAKRKSELLQDDYIYSCWISPSGNGLKALVKIPKEPENHEAYYLALIDKFPELDTTSKNISRVCYESYDHEIYINKDSKVWDKKKVQEVKKEVVKKEVANKHTDYSKVNQVLNIVRNAVDGEKHYNLLKASKLAGGFISGGEVDEFEITRLLEQEMISRGVDDVENTLKTIQDGINHGKGLPISEPLSLANNDYSFLSDKELEKEWINLVKNNAVPQGLDIGSEHFDNHYRLKERTMVGIFGVDNVGKTTFHTFLAVCYSKKHKVKWLFICKENQNAAVRQKIMELYCGKKLHLLNDTEFNEAYEFSYEYFDIINNKFSIEQETIFKVLEKAILKKHYFAIFIDPYNSIQYDQLPKENYKFLDKLRDFQDKHNTSFHISMHISTEKSRNYVYSDKDTIINFEGQEVAVYGQPKIPRKNFVEGGQPIANKLDDVIVVHRIFKLQELRDYTLVSIEKVKETQTGGQPTFEEPIMFKKEFGFDTFKDKNFRNPLTSIEVQENNFVTMPINDNFDNEYEQLDQSPF